MPAAVIIAACRTPIGRFQGGLSAAAAPELGAVVIREALNLARMSAERVDEVIIGNVLSAGVGQAPARQAALLAGVPAEVPAVTINKVCGSGLKAVMLADQAIRAGDARVIVAGGMECMSRAPYLLMGARAGWKFGHQQALDSMLHDGLWCASEQWGMGEAADYIASSQAIRREDQDALGYESHRRAIAAIERGRMSQEIVPVTISQRGRETRVDRDEGPRADTSLERLAALRPAFSDVGTVTAGNSSQLSDGAAALLVVDEEVANESSAPLKARIVATAASGVAPKEIFIAPVSATRRALAKAGLTIDDIDLFEINEAFAAQCVACARGLGIGADKLNVDGGAIALGHPIGASGARVLTTLLYSLAERGGRRGLATLCLGGGNAVALIVERL